MQRRKEYSRKVEAAPDVMMNVSVNHRIIIDTDTAGDDALALAMCAKAPNITVEGVTVLEGNVSMEQGVKNALMVLETAGRNDIPVYRGADTTLDGTERECFSVFGTDGMGDQDLIHPSGDAEEGSGIDFIIDTVRRYPDEIEILAIGPATDVALAIEKDPETMKHVKMIWSMGTAGFGPGNATPVAEFNVYHDPKAYAAMMEAGIPVTVIGLDMCETDDVLYDDVDMKELAESSDTGAFLVKAWSSIREFKKHQGDGRVDICDGVAAGVMIWDDFAVKSEKCSSYVCTEHNPTEGQVIFYKESYIYDSMPKLEAYDKKVITGIKGNLFRESVMELLK